MIDQPDTLLEAVHALTRRWNVDIRDDNGKLVNRVRHRPRLQMLEDAIAKSSGNGGGASLARERSLIDSHAAQMHADYRRQINAAAKILDVPAGDPIPTLEAWYAASLAKVTTDAFIQQWIDTLSRWRIEIDSKLNPPETTTIEHACPACEAVIYNDPRQAGAKFRWPLRGKRWFPGQHGIDNAYVDCLACGAKWDGIGKVRELAWTLEQYDTPENASA